MSDREESSRTWLVTGASKGFGQALVTEIAERGDKVVGTFRDPDQIRTLEERYPGIAFGIQLDVTDAEEIPRGIQKALDCLGHIDVLVNNAGYGQFGAMEDLTDEQIRRLMETNFFGLLNVIRAVLPHFRQRRGGRIVNISSAAGFTVYSPGAAVYTASKYAVEGLSEALALEVGPLGIGVTIVEPGSFRTEFGASSMDMSERDSPDYQEMFGPMRTFLTTQYHGTEPGDPVKGVKVLLEALNAPEPPARLILGEDAVQAIRHKLEVVEKQIRDWEALSSSTNFDA